MQRFSWKSLDDGRLAKELDFSSFKHNGTGIPKECHPFFGIKNKKNTTIILNGRVHLGDGKVGHKEAFRASLDWDTERSHNS